LYFVLLNRATAELWHPLRCARLRRWFLSLMMLLRFVLIEALAVLLMLRYVLRRMHMLM